LQLLEFKHCLAYPIPQAGQIAGAGIFFSVLFLSFGPGFSLVQDIVVIATAAAIAKRSGFETFMFCAG
jgi:hypothetical protein